MKTRELAKKIGLLSCIGMDRLGQGNRDRSRKMVGQNIRKALDPSLTTAISGGAWKIYTNVPERANGM